MAKTKQELDKYLLDLYEKVYDQGHSYDDVLAVVGHIVRMHWIVGFQEETIVDTDSNIKKWAVENFNKEEIDEYGYLDYNDWKDAYLTVVKRWEEKQAPVEKRSTSPETRQIMQSFARMLPSGLTYIDPAVGTGQLVMNTSNSIIGQDIDFRLTIVADTLIRIGKDITGGVNTGDSLGSKYDIFKNEGIYIFDPPIGKKQKNPEHWKNEDTKTILGQDHRDSNDTEIIFLVNFLLYAKDNSYFICKMPSNFLTARNKELDALRKYLIENNLMCAIKSSDGFVILAGCKSAKHRKTITTIRFNKSFFEKIDNIKLLDAIANEIISEDNDFKLYLSQNFYEIYDDKNVLLNEIEGNIIKLPIAEFEAKEYDPPAKYFNQIIGKEHEIVLQLQNIRSKFIEYGLDKVENIKEVFDNKEIPKVIELVENTPEVLAIDIPKPQEIKIILPWYKLSKKEEVKKEVWEEVQALTYIDENSSMDNVTGVLKRISLPFDNYKTFFNYLNVIKNRLNIIKINEDENDLNVLQINLEKNIINSNINNEILMPINFDLEKRIEPAISLLSKKQKEIYDFHCKYWFNFANFNTTEFKKYSKAELYSAFTTLNKLGLVINKYEEVNYMDEIQVELEIYDKFRPFHPLIIGGID